jgi:NAD(P)-dependent dehydrogenase (short-subunit alcohol dehydrogenase family)
MFLENKNAVIYGGGGAIGGAVARAFAREGAKVFLAGRLHRARKYTGNGRIVGMKPYSIFVVDDEPTIREGVAHEIRDPLSGINIHLSVLEKLHQEEDGFGEEGREKANRIINETKSASRRIENVIKKVMDFSRSSAFRLKWTDINEAVVDAIDFSMAMLRKRGITLDRSGIGP